MSLKVKKINDKVNGLDVKGQGCDNDCPKGYWSGNNNKLAVGCKWNVTKPTAQILGVW
ncbi:hypothetical protein acsn021_29240 [Anaerocolumna cellulosilytica]|uniref:Uncharacterized protein n=1 Tax=Anaerocolumna cellulosilytica TaxID=433286 RepID=A0A6S6R7Y8_9FIRM|nr:hypothetical protein [Anaerocolumna cellulosilytica]MBB5197142.1 hypothetical protein [Anaerocolumna cellulosilytica]BCJ95355.1 hypothetical protein acsn021_29240 [Anaerocolumna cellulosilytica]